MRGRIVFLHPATETGVIFGADRTRYRFSIAEWQGKGSPPRNLEIEFTPAAGEARAIQPFQGRDPVADEGLYPAEGDEGEGDEALETMPAAPGAAASGVKGQAGPIPVMLADRRGQAAAGPAFAAAGEAEEGDEVVPEIAPLRAGRLGSATGGAPLGGMLFAQQGAASRRPSWIYYLVGIGAAVALILVAYIAVRFL